MTKPIREHILDLIYPVKCPFCRRILEQGQELLCPDCQKELPWTQGKEGERTGEFFGVCTAPLWYRDMVRDSHHRYKFGSVRCYAAPYAILMAQCAADRLEGDFDLVTWAPLSRRRLRSRGYDQAQLLAQGLAEQLDLPVRATLNKVRHTAAQSDLEGVSARRANVLGAYALREDARVEGKRVLLVDDVMTTGATLAECARILRTAGALRVDCITLALA